MAFSKSKSKSKSKSFSKTTGSYPVDGWQTDMEAVTELPNFFETPGWRDVLIDPPPGPVETRKELDDLLVKQETLRKAPEQWRIRKPEIELEAVQDNPYFGRLLLFGNGSGVYPNTYVLMQAMVQLGFIVVCQYKKRFLRPRPSQLEPKLRPLIDVPAHASYPSGHSLQYHLVAKALASVIHSHETSEQLFLVADRIAENREWAGLHYRSDSEAGARLASEIFPFVQQAYTETFRNAAREWI